MRRYSPIASLLIILAVIYWSFYALMPQNYSKENTPLDKFATERALVHVNTMSKKPHYTGASYHEEVQKYIIRKLEELGLYVETQEGYIFNRRQRLSKPKNILTRIKGTGNGEALLLLAHYDSSPHSSLGASDDASGVATILEGIRAFIAADVKPKNDIIILISDAEELGLIGAELFVKEHPWVQDVRLVLNFEARGSGGPGNMLIETNGGNTNMIRAFKKAHVPFPVANSLAYTIYKMLPNDTDLTIFREKADINGFNFAFIDDHFDYHTLRDNARNLDRNTLEHQGTYLMSLLQYFAYADLNDVKSMEDSVYFNTPLGLHSYSFMWIFPFLIVACIAFGFLVYIGFKKERLSVKPVLIGFLPFSIALTVSTAIAYYGWNLLLHIYPQYNEIRHGFPYNGHLYIAAFIVLTLAICFISYSLFKTKDRVASYTVAPLFIWLIINSIIAIYVKGASFFIVPVYFCLLLFYFIVAYQKPNAMFLAVIAIPVLVICVPFLQMLPVGLGLDTVFVCALLATLIFGLLLPVFGFYKFKRSLALLLFIGFGVFLLRAHFKSNFDDNRQKPNSLLYVFNADENNAYWATYDAIPDDWTTRKLGNTPRKASEFNETILSDSYDALFRYVTKAPVKKVLPPKIEISRDTIIGAYRQVEICITPQRPVNKIDVFADDATSITALTANGEQADSAAFGKTNKKNGALLFSYYVTDDKYLEIQLRISKDKPLTLSLNEASFDLLNNNAFTISPRSKDMIPKPFLLNDAVVVKKTIKL